MTEKVSLMELSKAMENVTSDRTLTNQQKIDKLNNLMLLYLRSIGKYPEAKQ